MSKLAEPMARLIEELKKLPGIGSKSAQRLAFHILRSSDEDADALADAVRELKASLRLCSVCNNITDIDPCVYCTSPTRNQRMVCVVEEPTNIAAIEQDPLQRRLSRAAWIAFAPAWRRTGASSHLWTRAPGAGRADRGVILATNPTVEGEATAVYLLQASAAPA